MSLIKMMSRIKIPKILIHNKRSLATLYDDSDFLGNHFDHDYKSPSSLSSSPSFVSGDIFSNSRLEYGSRRFYRGKIKAAIFDWGGTVVDCGVCAPILTYVELFRDEGIEITEDEARAPMGSPSHVHIRSILEKEAIIKRWKSVKDNQPPNESDVERMTSKFIPQILKSLSKYTNVINGVTDVVSRLRSADYNLKIGSTTGYPKAVLDVLLHASKSQGFTPDSSVCLSDVLSDKIKDIKPNPWMLWKVATNLSIMPIESLVKVDDSVNGIHEGLLAGTWTVGIAQSSSYVGLDESHLCEIGKDELSKRMNRAYKHLTNSGAHYVIDTIYDLPAVINDINRKLASGMKP